MTLGLIWLLACGEKDVNDTAIESEDDTSTESQDDSASDIDSGIESDQPVSNGCGILQSATVEQRTMNSSEGERGYHLVVLETYDPDVPSRLIFGFPGTNWVGLQIRSYLGLEAYAEPNDIFVYPDPLWRDFTGWGNLGGWVLGPHARPADGMQDLDFTAAIIDELSEEYCIDPNQVYATGHSWGGDMAQVVSCFLGDRFRATVPVAANRPYWFEPSNGASLECTGETAVWTMFGSNETHFTSQAYSGQYGDECRDFWLEENGCEGSSSYTDLNLGPNAECVEFDGCDVQTRYCLYDGQYGHQIPSDYYAEETMKFFHSFE